jgi:hypothetical protein
MPQFQTLDYGAAIRSAETIKYDRLRNQALGAELKEHENMLQKRAQYEEIRARVERTPDEIQELEAAGLWEEADKLKLSYAAQLASSVEITAAMREAITADNYKQTRQDLINAGVPPSLFPVEYSDTWFRDQSKKARDAMSVLTFRDELEGQTVATDYIIRNGTIFKEGKPYRPAASVSAQARQTAADKKGEEGFKMPASIENSISSQVAGLYGASFDPATGVFFGIKGEDAKRAQTVREEAAKRYKAAAGKLTVSEAVAQAGRAMGIPLDRLSRETPLEENADPLGLFAQ